MKPLIITEKLITVSGSLYTQCYRHNEGLRGTMRKILGQKRSQGCPHTRIFYIEDQGELMAWALVSPQTINYLTNEVQRWEVNFYVRRACRNKGLGFALAKYIREFYLNDRVGGHTEYSTIMHKNGISSVWRP